MSSASETGEHQVLDFNHDGRVSKKELALAGVLALASFLGAVFVGFAISVACGG